MTRSHRSLRSIAVVLALSASAAAQAIQLRTGEVLVGEVVDATSDGLSFRRLDTGGFLELGWDDLSTLHATRIKRLKGLVVEQDEEPTIEADVIIYSTGGGAREELIGLIDWNTTTPTYLMLKRKRDVLPLRRSSEHIKNIRKRDVSVLEVYTADEWYELKQSEIGPGDDPDKHIALAEEMRRVGEFERARHHLEEADRLGGGKQSAQLPMMLRRVQLLQESEAERELLAQIRIMRNRDQFDRAEELMAEFEDRYPDSRLVAELQREKQRHGDALAAYAVDRLRQMWDATVRRAAEDKVAERGVTLMAARSYAEGEMAQDVFERIARTVELEPEEVAQYWSQRDQHGRGRAAIFSFGIGSWVLDEGQITAGTKVADGASGGGRGGAAGVAPGEDRELERILRRLQEYRQQRNRAGASGSAQEETEEDWWNDASRDTRAGWLRAYFAEFGGQMEVTAAYAAECGNCHGAGFILELGDSGREQRTKCSVCHGTKFTRTIRAR